MAYPRRFLGRVGRTPYHPHSLGDGSERRRGKGLKTVCIAPTGTSEYGVETRSSEQTMLSDEAHVLLVTDSSSEEDSETDDQSYPPPPEVHALTWQAYIAHIVHMVSCIAMSFA